MKISRTTRLDLYVLTEVIGPFLGGIVFFLFIFLMFQVLRLADTLIVHGVSGWLLLKMVFFMTLSFVPFALPIAFLIAVLMGFGRLSADSELVAMKAHGISLARLSVPITLFSLVIVVLGLALNLEWVPQAERAFKSTLVKVGNTKVLSSIKEGTFNSGFFDLLIFADKVDSKSNRLSRVFIYDERSPKNPMAYVAREAEVLSVKTGSELSTAAMLKLYEGSSHQNSIEDNTYQKYDFQEQDIYLNITEGSADMVMKPRMILYHDLVQKIRATSADTYEGREFRGEFWRRVAVALSPLIFVFLGIGFGTVRTRAVRSGAALTAFVILLAYWAIQTAGTLAVQRGSLPPFFAMQLPNLIAAMAAAVTFRRSSW